MNEKSDKPEQDCGPTSYPPFPNWRRSKRRARVSKYSTKLWRCKLERLTVYTGFQTAHAVALSVMNCGIVYKRFCRTYFSVILNCCTIQVPFLWFFVPKSEPCRCAGQFTFTLKFCFPVPK